MNEPDRLDPVGLDQLRIDRDDEPRGRPWLRWTIFALVAAAAVAAAAWWLLGRAGALEVETAEVVEIAAGEGAPLSVLDASGYVTARRQATVSSEITGRLTSVKIEEGMAVEEGQVLARLDDATQTRALALAEAELTASRSRLREIEVMLRQARIDLERERSLSSAGVASQASLDSAEAGADSLAARLEAARDEVSVSDRRLALARQDVERTFVRAPFSGIAISKDAQPGEIVSPVSAGGGFTRTGISTIVDMTSLEIEVDVNEAYIGRVLPGQEVDAVLDAYPGWRIPARVITTIPAADRQKATFKVRIGFVELGDPRILPDMGVKVSFRAEVEAGAGADGGAETARRLLVPRAAVRGRGGEGVVFVLRDDRVERRAVSLGGASGERIEVVAGLRAGERVVLEPPEQLADGDRVRPVASQGGAER
jgi:RND family efflux transporter MFP subunit